MTVTSPSNLAALGYFVLTDEQVATFVEHLRGVAQEEDRKSQADFQQLFDLGMAVGARNALDSAADLLEESNALDGQQPQFVLLLMTKLGGTGHWGLSGIFHDNDALVAYLDKALRNYTIEYVSEYELAVKSNGFRVHQVLRDMVVKADDLDRAIPFAPFRIGW